MQNGEAVQLLMSPSLAAHQPKDTEGESQVHTP